MRTHRYLSLITFNLRLAAWLNREAVATIDTTKRPDYSTMGDTPDHGFTAYFKASRLDPTAPVYSDRLECTEYLAGMSPKLRYSCGLLDECLFRTPDERGKLLCYIM